MEIFTGDDFARELGVRRSRSGKSYRRLATEIGLGQATISGWCTGGHLPQTAVTDRFLALLDSVNVPAVEQDAFVEALVRLRSVRVLVAPPDINPYPGLRAFRVDEADRFFGREELTAAGGDDGTVHVWKVAGDGPPVVLTGPTSKIYSIAVSPDGRSLAAATSSEHVVYRWDLGHPVRRLPDRECVSCPPFAPSGRPEAA